jgi:hypothetical protein
MKPFELAAGQPAWVAGLVALAGLLVGFWGHRLVHLTMRLDGLVLGMLGGACAAPILVDHFQMASHLTLWIGLTIMTIGGVAGYLAARPVYFMTVLLLGGAVGLAAWMPLRGLVSDGAPWPAWAIPAALALTTGLLALKFERPLVILGTALLGAGLATAAGFEAAGVAGDTAAGGFWRGTAMAALAAGGAVTQFLARAPKGPSRENKPA